MNSCFKNISFLCLVFQFNYVYSDRFGDPGEVIAIEATSSDAENNLTIIIDDSLYKLIPLPFDKQNSFIETSGQRININQKDFGESRITVSYTHLTLPTKRIV